jgi:hypothetical protein
MFLQQLLQNWRTNFLEIFGTEVEDMYSFNISLKLLYKSCSVVFAYC